MPRLIRLPHTFRKLAAKAARRRITLGPGLPGSMRMEGASLVVTLPRGLRSPNHTYWGHWTQKRADRQAWERELAAAIYTADPTVRSYGIALGHNPVRVAVERHVRSRRDFIPDDDNLRFCVKPLNDALTRVGLIYDDSRDWLDQSMPTQTLSRDGCARTILRIEPRRPATQEPA